jgi:DNA-binding MarR family transcriptional regulator
MNIPDRAIALENIGLSAKEARVYLAALSLGPSTVSKIAVSAEVNRTTVYPIVRRLISRGLMGREIRGFKEFLFAERPERLEGLVDAKRKSFLDLLPELAALHNLGGDDGTIRYYEGLEGVKSVYENLLTETRAGDDYLVIADERQWIEVDAKYFLRFMERRSRLPFKVRMLLEDSQVAREREEFGKNLNQRVKILPHGTSLQVNIVVTPQQVVIHQLVPPISAIVIRNKSSVVAMRQCFEVMWGAS